MVKKEKSLVNELLDQFNLEKLTEYKTISNEKNTKKRRQLLKEWYNKYSGIKR